MAVLHVSKHAEEMGLEYESLEYWRKIKLAQDEADFSSHS
jgi:hypothetical protein